MDKYILGGLNENVPVSESKIYQDTLNKITVDDVTLYDTVSNSKLIDAIKKFLNLINGENISLTCGSDEAIELLIKILSNSDKNIVLPTPTYSFTIATIDKYNITTKKVPFRFNDNGDYKHLIIEKYIDANTNLVYICNPNNPNNIKYDQSEILYLLNKFPHINFIIDEAYIEYGNVKSMVEYVKTFANLHVIKTFSKFFGLAGIRIGYIISQKQFYYNPKTINNIGKKLAIYGMENYQKIKEIIDQSLIEKKSFIDELKRRNYYVYDGESSFFNIYLGDNKKIICSELDKHKILYRDMEKDYKKTGYIRFNLLTKKDYEIILEFFPITNQVPIDAFHFDSYYHYKYLVLFEKTMAALTEIGILSFITGGSLLGYVRMNNIMPWDDDVDLAFIDDNNIDWDNVKAIMVKHNLRIKRNRTDAYWQIDDLNTQERLNEIHIDLFPFVKKDNMYMNNDPRYLVDDPNVKACNINYPKDTVFPLIPIEFSYFKIKTYVNNKYMESLKSSVGDDIIEKVKLYDNKNQIIKYYNYFDII